MSLAKQRAGETSVLDIRKGEEFSMFEAPKKWGMPRAQWVRKTIEKWGWKSGQRPNPAVLTTKKIL